MSTAPDFRRMRSGKGVEVSSRGSARAGGLSKLSISSTRVAFEGRRLEGRSKAPARDVW